MKKVMRNILIGGVASLGVLIIMSSANYNNTINKENEKFLNVKSTEEIQVLFNEEKNNREKGYSAIHWLDATEEDINEQAEKMAKLVSNEIAPEGEKFVANEGGPSEQALRNKNGEEYRLLIGTWAEYSNGSTKKIPQKSLSLEEENYEEISNSISSSTALSLFHIFVGRYERLKGELNALKRMGETNLIIDRRKSENTETQNSALVSPTLNLTERELKELKNAISEDFIEERGWSITKGRIKENGLTIYNRGYLDAINKILEIYNNNIPE